MFCNGAQWQVFALRWNPNLIFSIRIGLKMIDPGFITCNYLFQTTWVTFIGLIVSLKVGYLEFSHLTELKNIYHWNLYLKKRNTNHQKLRIIKLQKKFFGWCSLKRLRSLLTLSQTTNFRPFHFKDFADGNFRFDKSSPNGLKKLWEKEKLLATSNFSFYHSVSKRLLLHTRKNQGLFGKGLSYFLYTSQRWDVLWDHPWRAASSSLSGAYLQNYSS